jgi:thioesterase DpgC
MTFAGDRYDEAATRLADFVAEREVLLARLPGKAERSAGQAAEADRIRRECQEERAGFLAGYAPELYRRLTDGLRRPLRVEELAEAAADALPGLVPDAKQLAEERSVIQARK